MSSGSAEAGGCSESSSEDSLESSLNTLQIMPNDFRSDLDDFRANWQIEIKQKQSDHNTSSELKPKQQIQTVEEVQEADNVLMPLINDEQAAQQALAKKLFHKAVELEQRGKVYDAIPFYRKAVQIEPNIEFKCYENQKSRTSLKNPTKVISDTDVTTKANSVPKISEEHLLNDLYLKFQLDLSQNYHGQLIQSGRESGIISTEMHISELPPELLIYILRWVVSNHLDMRSLEQCAAVCKGMYILARDEELWRSVCVKVWGHNVGIVAPSTAKEEQQTNDSDCPITHKYSTWRQMFIEREHVLFNGCYISKTTYLRMGENSFQDQYYRPVQLVEYYRYIRFLPDGTVLMMTSSDEPTQGVTKLKNLHTLRPDVLRGHYRLFSSTLSIVVSKQQQETKFITNSTTGGGGYSRPNRQGNAIYDEGAFNRTKYCIEFRILNTLKRKFAQLIWLRYSIVQTRNKQESTSEFELTPSKYPPLWFSPVRSYHLHAEAPLAYCG